MPHPRKSTDDDVEYFLKQLRFQAHDYHLRQQGVELDIYFDTSDVRGALLGLHHFYAEDGTFQQQAFESKYTLVQCLATGGWLGPISMLRPHQAELLGQIDGNFPGIARRPFQDIALELLKEVGLGPGSEWTPQAIGLLSDEDMDEFVLRHAESGERFYKALQGVRYGTWKHRLRRLREGGLLTLRKDESDLNLIMASEEFRCAQKGFEAVRPNFPINNFADAVAVSLLIEKLRAYRSGDAQRIPRFLVPSRLFLRAIDRADLHDELLYDLGTSRDISVLRNTDYFIFRAIFSSVQQNSGEGGRMSVEAEVRELRKALEVISESREPLTADSIRAVELEGGGSLHDLIERIRSVSFFDKVWLRTASLEESDYASRHVAETAKDPRLRNAVGRALSATKKELRENAEDVRRLSRLALECSDAAAQLQRRTAATQLRYIDFFKDFGLARYALPDLLRPGIQQLAASLLSQDDEVRKQAVNTVARMAYIAEKQDTDLSGPAMVAAIMFLLRLDRQLVQMCEKLKGMHPSIRLLYVASLCRRATGSVVTAADFSSPEADLRRSRAKLLAQAQLVIDELEGHYRGLTDSSDKFKLALGLGYIYFRLWEASGNKPTWRRHTALPAERVTGDPSHDKALDYVERTLCYGREAMALGKKTNPSAYSFAATHHMFYLVECGPDEYMAEMAEMADILSRCKVDLKESWQYRGDEALAHYFHRIALLGIPPRIDLLQMASGVIQQAYEASIDDEEVRAYKTMLDVATAATPFI
jgi:hypothetical protein